MVSNDASIQKDHEEFECQLCGRCCKELILGAWIEVHGEVLSIWKETPSLYYHPFYKRGLSEFLAAENWFSKGTVQDVWNFLESEEKRVESYIHEPVKFRWGGILKHCPWLEQNGDSYICLVHGDTKPDTCSGWPILSNDVQVEEARRIGCKAIEILEAEC